MTLPQVVTAQTVLDLALARPATLAGGRLICIDGPAGSGKTTLAAGIGAPVVHMDDIFEGWNGLEAAGEVLRRDVVAPLRDGLPGRCRRYDWDQDAYAEVVEVPPSGLLVIEGCGSAALAIDDVITVVVWVETDRDERLRRGLARDGEGFRENWLDWQAREDALFSRELTRERADLVLRT